MPELELSIISHGPDTVPDLQQLVEKFEAQHKVRVRLQLLERETAWTELVKFALYGHGPDVSEIGSTWLSSLVGMNALSPLTSGDLAAVGGPAAFLPPVWQTGHLAGETQLWAIPWLADTRVIYYWRNLLERAGVEVTTAFQTQAALQQSLERLQAAGVSPWIVPTRQTALTVHHVANWIWAAGGDFVSADGTQILFNQPAARAGIRAYFELGQYLAQTQRNLTDAQSDHLFLQGQAAVTISGPWIRFSLERQFGPEVIPQLGAAFVPGGSSAYLGASSFVIWRRSHQHQAALELIRFITGQSAQVTYSPYTGLLPTRLDALAASPLANDSLYQVLSQALKTGRPFPAIPVWGLMEEKLSLAFSQIWVELLTNPRLDLEAAIAKHLDGLVKRLNVTLRDKNP